VAFEHGDVVNLRYRFEDGRVLGLLPMWTISDDGSTYVGYTPSGADVMYWALDDGVDPRTVSLDERFTRFQTSAQRTWFGEGVVRVIPRQEAYQVLHFTEKGSFRGWYINLETVKTEHGPYLDTIDLHLDLWIAPDLTPTWKDEDEAEAALAAGVLSEEHLELARETGQRVIDQLGSWPDPIGDWREFHPPPGWGPLPLPPDWDS
jgi:Protein of unknown function (DUF402)